MYLYSEAYSRKVETQYFSFCFALLWTWFLVFKKMTNIFDIKVWVSYNKRVHEIPVINESFVLLISTDKKMIYDYDWFIEAHILVEWFLQEKLMYMFR